MAILKNVVACTAAALMVAQPAVAADLAPGPSARESGIYGGAYIRLPLGAGGTRREEARAGLSLGPTLVVRGADLRGGERRIQGNLVDLAVLGNGRPSLMLAGRQLVDARGRISLQAGDEEDSGGIPSWVLVAGGVVVAAGVGYFLLLSSFACDDDEQECD